MKSREYFIAGCILNKSKSKAILGTNRGNLFTVDKLDERINLSSDSKKLKKVTYVSGVIRSIKQLDINIVLIGLKSGEVFEFDIHENKMLQIRHQSGNGLWRLLVIDKNRFIITGKYGYIGYYYKEGNFWKNSNLYGSKHSNFCLDFISNNEIITVDYWGNCIIWKIDNNNIIPNEINTHLYGNMQHATSIDYQTFGLIHLSGYIYLFEKNQQKSFIDQVSEYSTSSGEGKDIILFENFLICGTAYELLKINLDNNSIEKMNFNCVSLLKSNNNKLFVLSPTELINIDELELIPFEEIQQRKYAKIGIIGLTGTGKSTLCYRIKENKYNPQTSTLGRKMWPLTKIGEKNLPKDSEILIFDVAGQESQLFTFFPRFWDCKMIFACYRKTSSRDLDILLKAIRELKKYTPINCRYYLLQTWSDSENSDVEGYLLEEKCEELKIEPIPEIIEVSSQSGEGIDELRQILISKLDWSSIQPNIESDLLIEVKKYLEEQRNSKAIRWLTIDRLKNIMKKRGFDTPSRHLKFILKNLDDQGEIDYIPSIPLVIINDNTHNNLWSKVPTIIKNSGGHILINDLKSQLRKSKDLERNFKILEDVGKIQYFDIFLEDVIEKLINYRHALIINKNTSHEIIIMPESLKESFKVPQKYKIIDEYKPKKFCLSMNLNFPWYAFLERLKILEKIYNFSLKIIELSKNFALFSINDDNVWFTIDTVKERLGMDMEQLNIRLYFNGNNPNLILIIKKIIYKFLNSIYKESISGPKKEESIVNNVKKINKNELEYNNGIEPKSVSLKSKEPNQLNDDGTKNANERKSIVLIGTSPEDVGISIDRINYDKEFRKIEEVTQKKDNKYLKSPEMVLASRIEDLVNGLLRYKPQIVHISSHGFSNGLILEDDNGFPVLIEAGAISNLFRQFSDHIRCIIFNCCESNLIAKELSQYIDYVIGMEGCVLDDSAIVFAENFYNALSFGKNFKESYELAKNMLELKKLPDENIPKIYTKQNSD